MALLLAAACSSDDKPPMDDGNAAPAEQPSENESEGEGEGEGPNPSESSFMACDENADCTDGRVCRMAADAGAVVTLGRCVQPAGG